VSPLAVVSWPIAVEWLPMLASFHWLAFTSPARKARFAGTHIKRTPAPEAGVAPTAPDKSKLSVPRSELLNVLMPPTSCELIKST
jgi:hypothetical protein